MEAWSPQASALLFFVLQKEPKFILLKKARSKASPNDGRSAEKAQACGPFAAPVLAFDTLRARLPPELAAFQRHEALLRGRFRPGLRHHDGDGLSLIRGCGTAGPREPHAEDELLVPLHRGERR